MTADSPTRRADSHIHLFSGGYRGRSFASRPGVLLDEPACYDSLAREHQVAAALVVGYGAEDWCLDNNAYLTEQSSRFDWMCPLAYVDLDAAPSPAELEALHARQFVGVSLYVFGNGAQRLARISAGFWSWLDRHGWLVSVNSEGDAWNVWHEILERYPRLRVLVSHLGSPPATVSPPSRDQAIQAMRCVNALGKYPGVHVKLSGFYAISVPGHDYPHAAAWPYLEVLTDDFACERLLWGSDFSPCLDWVTFPQSFDLFGKLPLFSPSEVNKIVGRNLLALLGK